MTWNSVWPDGTVSVKANETPGRQNTTYIETNSQKDHYWAEDANNDGHHKKIEMPNISNISEDPFALDANGDPTSLSPSQECMLYTREKTATEATITQNDEPFAYVIEDPTGTPVNHYMQLGFRAMVHFTEPVSGTHPAAPNTLAQSEVVYSHNIALQSAGTPGVVRNARGDYTITFAVALPSQYYVVFGGGIRDATGTSPIHVQVKPSQNISTSNMTKSSVRVIFPGADSFLYDPVRGWIAICGG